MLIKPQEYMNRSGQAVATVAGFYKVNKEDIIVVTDDLALEPGRIRLPGGEIGTEKQFFFRNGF